MTNYVAYYRVSTNEQGNSGLGLEAQKSDAYRFLKKSDTILKEYTEVASGKNDERVELLRAIEYANNNNATLLIAKLDRLSRNAAFIFTLKDTGVKFVCADMPDANTLTIGIFATMAQHERELISKRTKSALAALKAKGVQLGKPENLTLEAMAKGRAMHSKKAREKENNVKATAMIKLLRKDGASLQEIANELNTLGFKTSRNKAFQKTTVSRLLKRI